MVSGSLSRIELLRCRFHGEPLIEFIYSNKESNAERGQKIRLISCRKATKAERKIYEERKDI
jgi:uncharacterized DUF497 family protein